MNLTRDQWLLSAESADSIGRLFEASPWNSATAAQREEFARSTQQESSLPRIMHVTRGIAHVTVAGVMTPERSFWAYYSGTQSTSYSEIRDAIAAIESDEDVTESVWVIDTPGGTVAGLFDTLAAVDSATKPISVLGECVCSAGYALASKLGPITANNKASVFGSVGVVRSFAKYTSVERADITSSEAPNKRPDPFTEAGKKIIQAELNKTHDLFVAEIAAGRTAGSGTRYTPETVNKNFGRGGTLLAEDALAAGLIDSIQEPKPINARKPGSALALESGAVLTAASSAAQTAAEAAEEADTIMDLATLKTKHPEVYQAAYQAGEASGAESGKASESKRVNAHLKLAGSLGPAAMSIAIEAIKSGASVMDEEVHAEYLAAGINRRESDVLQEQSDANEASVGSSSAPSQDESKDEVDRLADEMDARFGKVEL